MSMGIIAVTGMVVSAGVGIYSANKNAELAKGAATRAETDRNTQQAKLEAQQRKYESMTFENPYEDMENVYEDLTVNQQQAQFEAQQGAQQRANIMGQMRGAAGSSGAAVRRTSGISITVNTNGQTVNGSTTATGVT